MDVEKQEITSPGKFDIVLMLAVIEHFAHPGEVLRNSKVTGTLVSTSRIFR